MKVAGPRVTRGDLPFDATGLDGSPPKSIIGVDRARPKRRLPLD